MPRISRLIVPILCLSALPIMGGNCAPTIPGAAPFPLPLAMISAVQRFDLPNFTVSFDATGAIVNPGNVSRVNWVFGDGGGFVPGGLLVDHRFGAAGRYAVTAYLFDATGFVDTVSTSVNVVVPTKASDPTPSVGSVTVPASSILTWTPGRGALRNIVYLGSDNAAVQAGDGSVLQGEFTQAVFAPATLDGGTAFFWRVDSVTAGSTIPGDVWSFSTTKAPDPISSPAPADGELDVALDALLSWIAGDAAESHDVYFGTDLATVADAVRTSPEFQGNQEDPEFTPSDELDLATDYYWRIDEVGPGGTRKGAVFHFRTADVPGQISNPDPDDGAVDVPVDTMFTWTSGTTATSHDVYYGTSFDAVDNADQDSPIFRGNQEETTFEPTLSADSTFFWRIDEVGPGGVTKGEVFEFDTAVAPTQASELMPADGDIEISVTPTLTWEAGDNTDEHLVYFGPDRDDVSAAGATDETGILVDTLALGTEMFEPGAATPLEENTEYFWRIDERGPGGVTRGEITSFTTRNPIRAGDPMPEIDEEDVALNAVLMWSAGTQGGPPLSHDVYLGMDQTVVQNADRNAAVFMGNFPAGTLLFTPSQDLEMNTEYFWRIDERYDPNNVDVETEVAIGKVWNFETIQNVPEKAEDPVPADGQDQVDVNADLSWTTGDGAMSHDVYFGTDMAVVAGAGHGTAGVFKGNFQSASYALPELGVATDYYWRIDEVNDAGTTTGDVWMFTTLAEPGPITDPSPADGAVAQSIVVQLSWTADDDADSHDVYFGTSLTAVTNGVVGSATFKGNQTGTTYDPGQLLAVTTYYWRIDEVNDAGTSTGTVFSFTTGTRPNKATGPVPAHEAVDVSIEALLGWTAGSGGTISHDIYFGTSQSSVTNATTASPMSVFQGNQSPTAFDPGTLTPDTLYFWRVDEVGTGATRKGDVWRFRTARAPTKATLVAASGDGPANGAVGILLKPILQWTPGTGAGTVSHDVYFGTTLTAVQSASRNDAPFKQNQTGNMYMPGDPNPLTAGMRYFWRIDTVDSLGGTTKGNVFQFDTTLATGFLILNPADRPIGTPTNVTIRAQTGGGNLVSTVNASVTLNLSGSATGGGLVNLVNGQAVVAIDDFTPETVTLTLEDTEFTGLDVSSTQDVIFWGPVNGFRVERAGGGLIGAQVANVAFDIQVVALDAADQAVQDFIGTVNLTSTIAFVGGPTLLSSPFVNGVLAAQTFTFTADGMGVTIAATDSGGVSSGVSNPFTVNP